jgi:hypothetical protein
MVRVFVATWLVYAWFRKLLWLGRIVDGTFCGWDVFWLGRFLAWTFSGFDVLWLGHLAVGRSLWDDL